MKRWVESEIAVQCGYCWGKVEVCRLVDLRHPSERPKWENQTVWMCAECRGYFRNYPDRRYTPPSSVRITITERTPRVVIERLP